MRWHLYTIAVQPSPFNFFIRLSSFFQIELMFFFSFFFSQFLYADFSTDGRWCYIVLWVVPHQSSFRVDWESLKTRLVSACPSFLPTFYLDQQSKSLPPPVYLLKVFSLDRKGLLHGNYSFHSRFCLFYNFL